MRTYVTGRVTNAAVGADVRFVDQDGEPFTLDVPLRARPLGTLTVGGLYALALNGDQVVAAVKKRERIT